ncbi:hypothetical protein SERLADRAFT_411151 [Serpula lacrymans var. lacrymans S7.9]|nr:uncharacterized protein SERLADRAFT_411151 [Serpula lacrymans var. lacrymans S7.9]EGO20230.1 hypothetical protein SERLADRAFT_411151 [Serpula lacrymans var. lacrymans S7.9]
MSANQFTPIHLQPTSQKCGRCRTTFDYNTMFHYVKGKDGTGRRCCPERHQHYVNRQAASGSLHVEFSAVPGEVNATARKALIKASSAAQHGGYTSNHSLHGQQCGKMLAASTMPQHQVTIQIALHHLQEEGKSGSDLVGNIERDISVPLSITCCFLRLNIINTLQPLFLEWSKQYDLSLESLEMRRAPKLILYDPRTLFLNMECLVLHDFFYRVSGTSPIPKLQSNIKVKDILSWKEEHDHIVKTGEYAMGQGSDSDSSMSPMDKVMTMLKSKRLARQKRGSSSLRVSVSTLSCQITPAEHCRSLSPTSKPAMLLMLLNDSTGGYFYVPEKSLMQEAPASALAPAGRKRLAFNNELGKTLDETNCLMGN